MPQDAYSLESEQLPGLGKLLEESTELGTILAKLIAMHGEPQYFDGRDLKKELIEELGDLKATIQYFETMNLTTLEQAAVATRAEFKLRMFINWVKDYKNHG